MKQTAVILCILLLVQSIHSLHRADQFEKLSQSGLEQDNLVEVIQSSTTRTSTKLNKDYYSIKVMKKDKKDAYSRIKSIYEYVLKILIKNKIIPRQDNLVKSKIKPQYQSRKRTWVFSTIFVILGNPRELEITQNQLTKLGVQKLNTRPAINFLNEKLQSIEIFNSAKQKLTKKLETLGDYEIKSVVQIDIKGREVENSEIIQEQLQQEFNQSQEIIEEQDIVETQNTSAQGQIEMRIIFQVGKKEEQNSDGQGDLIGDYQEQQQDTDQSQSL